VAATFGPAYAWTVKTFGANRCMLESNFPVDKVGVSYGVLWNAHKRFTKHAGFSLEEREALFSGTAKRVYKIDG
jgi:predicted TIM-barrel fold metal-dependent hydrolase